MVKIISNGAQFDISAAVVNALCERLEGACERKNLIIIVPDQFEFETEKAVYKLLCSKNLLNKLNEISVETFSSLSMKILAEQGEKRLPADDAVKNILMHKAVREQKDALRSLSRQANRAGFCKKMIATVSMLKTAGFTSEQLSEDFIRENFSGGRMKNSRATVEKLCDAGRVFISYESYLSRYLDSLDVTERAAEEIAKNVPEILENAEIFIDCFNDFTGSQLYFISKIIERNIDITLGFSAVLDDNYRDKLFSGIKAQIDKICAAAKENCTEIVIETENIPRRINAATPLCELADNIFANRRSRLSTGEDIEIVKAANVFDELDYVCAKIKELCTEKNMKYREIAVLCADTSAARHIQSAFQKYEIPLFLDIPETILYQPAVNLFLALLNVLRDFSVESVLSYIKTGFLSKNEREDETLLHEKSHSKNDKISLSKKDIDDFESYIFEWDLHAKHLKKPFDFADSQTFGAICAEEVRSSVVPPVLALQKNLKDKDGAEITRLIYRFAEEEIGIERALYNRCLKPNSDEFDTELLRANQQLWDSLARIFETLESELSGCYLTLDEYYRLFSDICAGTVLAKPPQYLDCVLVGDIDRTRAVGVKAAFIVGADYDKFPSQSASTGIFSENETEILRESISEISSVLPKNYSIKSTKEQYCLSLYRAYRAVSLASKKLTISFPEFDEKGSPLSRSQVINEILYIFPHSKIIDANSLGDEFYCRSIRSAKQRYAAKLKEDSREKALLKNSLAELGCGNFTARLDEIRARKSRKVSDDNNSHRLSRETAQMLFDRRLGATSAEKLNLCKFRYFCEFGLKIREKNQRIFNVGNRGNAIHFVLQKVLEKYRGRTSEFFGLDRAALTALSRHFLEQYLAEETNGDFDEDKRLQFLFTNLSNAAADVLITIQAELSSRDYRPKFFELDLADEGEKAVVGDDENADIELPEAILYSDNFSDKTFGNNETGLPETDECILAKPLEIRLDDGSSVSIIGRIDRVDMFFTTTENGVKKSYLRVVDYKFNAKTFDVKNAKNGINIQMLLYLFALCDANRENKTKLFPGGISYVPSASSGAVEDRISALRLLAMNHRQNGLYVRDERTDAEAKKYANTLIDRIVSAENYLDEKTKQAILKAFLPEGENAPDASEFAALRDECISFLKGNLEKIFDGDVGAASVKYVENNIAIDGKNDPKHKSSCDFCRFSMICGVTPDKIISLDNKSTGGEKNE